MSLERGIDGPEPVGGEPIAGPAGPRELRRTESAGRLGSGTLACPACDAPVAPHPRVMSPADTLGCGFCLHAAPLREFLSLGEPTRPAHVEVRVVQRVTR